MAKIVGLPKLSPTMEEGTLVAWAKAEGDAVEVDDLLAEVETDKATMEFRSFDRGVLLKILVPAGATLAPDVPVAIIGQLGEDIAALVADAAAAAAKSPGTSAAAVEVSNDDGATGGGAMDGGLAAAASTIAASAAPKTVALAPSVSGRVLASPLVRRLARERQVDLRNVAGSGPGGRIVKRDLETIVTAGGFPSRGQRIPPGPPRIQKLSQMRKTIARRLTESKRDIPHYYLTIDIDAGPMTAARQAINADLAAENIKVSLNDLIIKGCARALRLVPEVNASFMGDAIHYHQRVDVSVAVAIPDGLITPVVRHADEKTIAQIAVEVRSLAERARDKRLTVEEFTDGTFSVSNLGMFGIDEFTAVINPPEAAILAVGAVRDEPVIDGGELRAGKRLRMTLSCDHRVIDGAVGARFLAELRGLLEAPVRLFL